MARSSAPQLTADIKGSDRVLRALDVIIDYILASELPAPEVIEEHSLADRPRVDVGSPNKIAQSSPRVGIHRHPNPLPK